MQYLLHKTRHLSLGAIGLFAISALSFAILIFLLLASPVSADSSGLSDSSISGANKSKVSVTITDSLALRLLDETATNQISSIELSLDLYPQGALTYDSFISEVNTSNSTGYKLYISSNYQDSNNNYTNALINLDDNIAAKPYGTIPTLSNPSDVTDVSFAITESEYSIPSSIYRNTWGYSTNKLSIERTLDEDTEEVTNTITTNTNAASVLYKPIPAYNTSITINETREAIIKHLTPITIGVNASAATAAGTYRNVIELTAIANPLAVDYSLSFDGNTDGLGNNDGTATNIPEELTETSVASQATFTIPDTIPERENYVFSSWNTEPDGSGTSYSPGDELTVIADDADESSTAKTLYAIWNQYTYMITYDCNSGSNCPSDETIITGSNPYTYTISSTKPTRTNYTFDGYKGSDNNTYTAGGTVSLSTSSPSITLTAQWEETCGYSGGCWTDQNGKVWTKTVVNSSVTWANAAAVCTNLGNSWRLPTDVEFRTLIGTSGSNATTAEPYPTLKSMWGIGGCWSSVAHSSSYAYRLYINSNNASVYYSGKTASYRVVCTK